MLILDSLTALLSFVLFRTASSFRLSRMSGKCRIIDSNMSFGICRILLGNKVCVDRVVIIAIIQNLSTHFLFVEIIL